MDERSTVIEAVKASENFKSEVRYIGRGGYRVADQPRLFKVLEHDVVRVVFPTLVTEVAEGTIVGLVTLYDRRNQYNVYAHTLCAGPGTNILLRAFDSPMPQASPQPQPLGNKAIRQFCAWKEASWVKFLNDELELGTEEASRLWLASFWKALDRMFGYGYLIGFDPDEILKERAISG
ncbi:MAG: hypothetical protein ACK53A_09080 [Gemmatimonadota bacterium]|jgi:hypothetical protein|nr:hypothetical protein [Gemmatimonadota bacterium]